MPKKPEVNYFEQVSERIKLLDDKELESVQAQIGALLEDRKRNPVSKKALKQARVTATMNSTAFGRFTANYIKESELAIESAKANRGQNHE